MKERAFMSSSLPREDLAILLQRIDENLSMRSLIREEAALHHTDTQATEDLLPDIDSLMMQLQAIREMHAPLFVGNGRTPADRAKQLLNVPIRVFGYKQIGFNHKILNLVDNLLLALNYLRARQHTQDQLEQLVLQQQQQIKALQIDFYKLTAQINRDESQHNQTE